MSPAGAGKAVLAWYSYSMKNQKEKEGLWFFGFLWLTCVKGFAYGNSYPSRRGY
jgi:hypothetical protein